MTSISGSGAQGSGQHGLSSETTGAIRARFRSTADACAMAARTWNGGGSVLLNAVFTGAAIQVLRDDGDRSARRMFAFSLLYLFLIFSLLLVDHFGGRQ